MIKSIIFAVDTDDRKSAIKYCLKLLKRKDIVNDIYAIKVGILNIIDDGLSIVTDIKKKTGLPVICDLKLAEIPTIAVDIAKKVYMAGADGIVVQGFVGKSVISAIQESVPDLDIYIVSEMTHNEGGFTQVHLEDIAKIAKEQCVTGIIGPGNRPIRLRKIRELVPNECKIIAAGVSKRQHGNEKEAFAAGADLVIEGSDIRSLLNSHNENKNIRSLSWTVLTYSMVGILLALFGIYINKTQWNFITDKPIINIAVPTIFAIIGAIIGYLKRS
ncbi:MAG: orotidine 5'-phosphate decarboxylase [Deltaproteobacteria bacterium]|jgi:orotidine-5'-phosphate decarboxylase|nr:orotidine 5'-phosphate decarboxylase [Deltaproteobacteria bacterium]